MKNYLRETGYPCGKPHTVAIDEVVVGSGVICRIPEFVKKYAAKRPFVLCDVNTFAAAGEQVCAQQTFRATKDIRDKYVLSRLAWDLGILEELCDLL